MDIQTIPNEVREAISVFLVPLQTSRVLNKDAFLRLLKIVEALAQTLKDIESVSKSVLNELYVTIQVMRAEAPYVKGETPTIQEMAGKLEYYFALILRNETPSERVSGVPRVM
jgi:hypothetical protein